jgi:hypothetical protein
MNFSDAQFAFLNKEFGLNKEKVIQMDSEALDDLYEKICEIEIAETINADDDPLSGRGKMAVELVNALAETLGYAQDG